MARLGHALLALPLLAAPAFAGNWPAWRGPTGDGVSPEKDVPLRWSSTENVRWKVPLPDAGSSSPVVWGDRVFLTQASEKTKWPPRNGGGPAVAAKRSVLCFRRADGKLLWARDTTYPGPESTHPTNPFCSASPVTDGERVVASLGSAGVVCYDFEGKELWKKDVGRLEHIWGNASSPVLHDDLAILWCGPGERQFLLAVNKRTGETVWEHQEPGGKYGRQDSEWLGTWATPIVARVNGRDELILPMPGKLKAFDPKTGKELWSCAGLGRLAYGSPVCSADGIVVSLSGFHGPGLAVRAGGSGDVTQTRRLWHHQQAIPQRIGSPVIVGGHAYLVNEPGTAQCFELQTGKDLWNKERVTGKTWGSLVAAAGRLYVTSQSGETVVLAASPKLDVLAKNSIREKVDASPAISDGEVFIRSFKHLWCIGDKK